MRLLEERQIFGVDSSNIFGDLQQKHFNDYIESLDVERSQTVKDKQHPTDKSRSYIKDIETRMENYAKRKQKLTGLNIVNSKEAGYIRSKLKEEYFPKPKKVEDPAADAKAEEKFEPFYEGEKGEPAA